MADKYLTDEDKAFLGMRGSSSAPRSVWRRFYDNFILGAVNSPLGAEPVARTMMKLRGLTDEQINAAERRIIEKESRQRQIDEEAFKDVDTFSPANIGKHAADLIGGLIGGADPTYAVSAGKNITQRALTQGGVNAGVDVLNQSIQLERGIRDEYDPVQTGVGFGTGVAVQGGKELASKAIAGLRSKNLDLQTAVGIGNKFGTVTSTVRSAAKNKKVGGAKNSHHLYGRAIDIARGKGVSHKQLERAYRRAGYDIIESLDEGDHSHFAFRFGKSKASEAEVKVAENEMRPGQPILEDFDFRPPEVRDLDPEVEAIIRRADDANVVPLRGEDPTADFAPPLDSSHEKFTPYVERPNTPANEQTGPFRQGDLDDAQMNEAGFVKSVVDGRWVTREEGYDEAHQLWVDKNFPEGAEVNYDNVNKDVLTPAERQEMDASAVRPEVRGALSEDILDSVVNKGSVASTPVNDLGGGGPRGPVEPPRDGGDGDGGSGPTGPLSDLEPEARLIQLLKRAKPLNATQRALYAEQRSKQASSLSNLQKSAATRENIKQQFASLRGQLPRVDFESFAKHFTEDDFTHLANKINFAETLLPFQKINAIDALSKLLGEGGARLPTPGEIKLLQEVYSPDFIQALLDNRTLMKKFWHGVGSALNVPRAIMSSFDFSAPFRQGVNFVGKKEFWKSIPTMFKVFGSEANSKALMKSIKTHPNWEKAVKARLAIVDPHSHFLADREEAFMGDWAEKIPIFGKIIEGSNRAYSGFLNKLRMDVFNDLLSKYEAAGEVPDTKKLRQIASFINAATGRGNMGKTLNAAAPALAGAFFSPRLIGSRVQMIFNPNYVRSDPILRKEAWKSLLAYGSYALSLAALGKYALGMDVEDDPRHPDFMKPKVGNTRYDIMGGYQQYIRLGAQLLTNEKITGKGNEVDLAGGRNGVENQGPFDESLADVIGEFARNKESPIASFLHTWLDGENTIGEPFELKKELKERFLPMAASDIAEVMQEEGYLKGAVMGAPTIFGIGVQTYEPRKSKEKPVSDEDFLSGAVDDSSDASELSAEDKEFLGL